MCLGRGGMGVVYEAIDLGLERKIALKIIPLYLGQDKLLIERFKREAKMVASLQHPQIVPIHSVGTVDNIHFYTMGFMPGGTLLSKNETPSCTLIEVIDIIIQIGQALGLCP